MPAELIERGSLHRQNAPVRIVGRMGAGKHVERPLEIAVVGERAAVAGEQRLVAGMGDGGLLEHRNRLGALPGGAERLAIAQRGVDILGIGAIAFAIDFDGAARIGIDWHARLGLASAFELIEPVMSDMVLQPPRLAAKIAVTAADARSRARLEG